MIKKLSRSTGNKIYSVVGWFCYIACTIISAILNVYLLSKLDQSWAWFLLTMSLALEFGKAYILIKANTYRSLAEYMKNCKFKSSKVINKEKVFYSLYVLFAVLSITASLCFSLTITDKTEQGFSQAKQQLSNHIEEVEDATDKLAIAKSDKESAELFFEETNKKWNKYYKDGYGELDYVAEKIKDEKGISLQEARRSKEYMEYKRNNDIVTLEDDYKNAPKRLEDAKENYAKAEEEFNLLKNEYGTINELKIEMEKINNQELEEAGSSKCFILLANTFGIPDKVKMVKFFILLYVSLLVELCIWLSSPDLRLDGGLLYSFRNDLELSTKKDVDRLLKEIKDTNNRFSSKEKEEEVKIVEKTPPKVLKELDNLKEQVEMFDREREENKAIVADLHMTYKDQIDRLNNQITSLEDDKNILENKEKDLRVQVDTLNEEIEEANDNKSEWEDKIKSLEEEKDYYQSEYSELAENEEHSKEALKYLTDKNRELEEKISKVDSNLKYSEDDIKKAVKKTLEKSKDEIKSLKSQLENWETNYNKVFEENSNLKLTNASLENNNKNLLQKNEELLNPKKKLSEIKVGTLEDEFKEIMENN